MKYKTQAILIGLFMITVAVRLLLAFSIPEFTYDSYFHLRQVEHIRETGLPLYHDLLSYGGRDFRFLPFFHYFMAFFSLFLPLSLVAKIIPNILVASLTITSYLISKKITKNETASLLSAMIAGFLPVLFSTNSFTVDTLSLPLTFFVIYSFFRIKEQNYLYAYIISFLILSVTSSSAFFVIIGFAIYALLSALEGKKMPRSEIEVMIFSLFFFLWVQFMFFKNSLLQEGISFIWGNTPSRIISAYFPSVSIAQALLLVSIIPFMAGVLVAYRSLFELKGQKSFLLISFVISTTLLTWLRLIKFRQSLAFFAVILAILFALFYLDLERYYKKTRLARYQRYVLPSLVVLLLISTAIPAINASLRQDVPTVEEVEAFKWLRDNTPANATVLATLHEGHLVAYYGQRKNLMDDQFILISDVDKRFSDLSVLFTTHFQTQAISLADQYGLRYLVLTPSAKENYDLPRLHYISSACFDLIYKNETKIYRTKCELAGAE